MNIEKLAEWAGFRKGYWSLNNEELWLEPNMSPPSKVSIGDEHLYRLPDFPSSLDACFKWLVPKLRQVTLSNGLDHPTKWMADVLAGGGVGKLLSRSYGEAETPALALCRAIEKLIDEPKE